MNTMLIVSVVVLWILVLFLLVLNLVLVRQLGVLHERIAPVGALMLGKGPEIGKMAPRFDLEGIDGRAIRVGHPRADGRSQLLFFLSPSCPVCDSLLPVLRALRKTESRGLEIILASDGEVEEHRRFAKEKKLLDFPYLCSTEVGVDFQVGRLPHAVLIDAAGLVRAQGLVNTREHIESLFEAMEQGVPSIQDYRNRKESKDVA